MYKSSWDCWLSVEAQSANVAKEPVGFAPKKPLVVQTDATWSTFNESSAHSIRLVLCHALSHMIVREVSYDQLIQAHWQKPGLLWEVFLQNDTMCMTPTKYHHWIVIGHQQSSLPTFHAGCHSKGDWTNGICCPKTPFSQADICQKKMLCTDMVAPELERKSSIARQIHSLFTLLTQQYPPGEFGAKASLCLCLS